MLMKIEQKRLTEQMAEFAHDAWRNKRAKEKNWHEPAKCPTIGYNCMVCHTPIKHGDVTKGDVIQCQGCGNKQYAGVPFTPCFLCRPLMVNYANLPEDEKELDRAYPNAFFAILKKDGYIITKKRPELEAEEEEDPDGEDAAE